MNKVLDYKERNPDATYISWVELRDDGHKEGIFIGRTDGDLKDKYLQI